MFGYIKPFKPEMKVREFDTYQAFYCGLCHQLGRMFGPFAKLTLSYDFTFLALVSAGLRPDFAGFCRQRCMANPLKKKVCAVPCADLSFTAGCAMILFYYKLRDNLQDSGFWKRLIYYPLLPFAAAARKKAAGRFPEADRAFSRMMEDQFALEKRKDVSLDRAADPTAAAMGEVFALLASDEAQKRVLSRFGYLVGRWVYLMDALDDLADDAGSGNFNPFLLRLNGALLDEEQLASIRQYGRGVLNVTVAEMGAAYELLEWQRYKSILDNVIYLGMPHAASLVLSGSYRDEKEKL